MTTNAPTDTPVTAAGRTLPDLRLVCWAVLSAATVALMFSTEFVPFYDYYQWLLQGHVVSGLLFGATVPGESLPVLYGLNAVPVPNLASPVVIGLLATVLPIEAAGHVFTALGVLGFAWSYAFLVRSLQRHPTAVEFTGLVWALGFYLYKGYLSYLFALPLAFVVVGVLHRTVGRSDRDPGRFTLGLLTLVGSVLYLSHLIGWSVAALATLVYVVVLLRRGRRASAARLALTVVPALVMLAWYTVSVDGGDQPLYFTSVGEKAVSLIEPLQFFVRFDPYPAGIPVFWANLAVWIALAALVALTLDREAVRGRRLPVPALWLGGLLAATALVLPFAEFSDLVKPDQRFVLPAVLILVAALPFRRATPSRVIAAAALGLVVLGLHLIEYQAAGNATQRFDAAADAVLTPGEPVLSVAVRTPGGCGTDFGPSIGVPAYKWVGVDHLLESGHARVNLSETSFVYSRFDPDTAPGLTARSGGPDEVAALVLPFASRYPQVQVLACNEGLTEVERVLAPQYRQVSRGDGFVILRRLA